MNILYIRRKVYFISSQSLKLKFCEGYYGSFLILDFEDSFLPKPLVYDFLLQKTI